MQSPAAARLALDGLPADRYDHRASDDFSQAGTLFKLLGAEQQLATAARIAQSMRDVPPFIVERLMAHFSRADPRYGILVAKALARVREDVDAEAQRG